MTDPRGWAPDPLHGFLPPAPVKSHRHDDLSRSTVPKGGIIMWFGAAADVPPGWVVCDGTNGTPDMRGRVPVGVDTGQSEFDTLGETGGSKTSTAPHTHDLANHTHALQSHTHTLTTGFPFGGGNGGNHWHGTNAHNANTGGHSITHEHVENIHVNDGLAGDWGTGAQRNTFSGPWHGASGIISAAATRDHSHNYNHGHGNTGTVSHWHQHSGTSSGPSNNTSGGPVGSNTGASSAGASSGNLQPYLALHFIMKV